MDGALDPVLSLEGARLEIVALTAEAGAVLELGRIKCDEARVLLMNSLGLAALVRRRRFRSGRMPLVLWLVRTPVPLEVVEFLLSVGTSPASSAVRSPLDLVHEVLEMRVLPTPLNRQR